MNLELPRGCPRDPVTGRRPPESTAFSPSANSWRTQARTKTLRSMTQALRLTPLLIVREATRAIDFYVEALGACERVRYTNEPLGLVGHADLAIADLIFSVTDELPAFNSDAPTSLGGSPVVLQLRVADVASLYDRMRQAGAEVVFRLAEFCGERMARLRDPFGHLWIISEVVEELTVEEIRERRNAVLAAMATAAAKRPE